MLYSYVDALIRNVGPFSGHLTHCKSLCSAGNDLAKLNSRNNVFFIVNGDFSINFMA